MSWLAGVPEARRRRYTILISIIAAAGLCYCVAFVALFLAPSNQAAAPVPTATVTPLPTATIPGATPQPGTPLPPTPTQFVPPSITPSATASWTPSVTPSATLTPSPTATGTTSPSPSQTETGTPTETTTPTGTPTNTPTPSDTPTTASPPPAPANFIATSTCLGARNIDFEWDAVPGALLYRIYRSPENTVVAETDRRRCNNCDQLGTIDTQSYYVVAVNDVAESAPSNLATVSCTASGTPVARIDGRKRFP